MDGWDGLYLYGRLVDLRLRFCRQQGLWLSAYGTRMAENGQFVNLIAKYSRLSNDFTVNKDAMAGSFDNNAFRVIAEYGWHWNLNDVGFLEP